MSRPDIEKYRRFIETAPDPRLPYSAARAVLDYLEELEKRLVVCDPKELTAHD